MSMKQSIKTIIAIIYCRVSSSRQVQEGHGLDSQESRCRNYAKLKGYPVVAVQPNDDQRSPGDSFDKMQKRAKEKGFPFPYLIDETQEVTRTYGATNTPHVYVLNRESGDKFTIKYIGAIDNNSKDAAAADKHYVQSAVDSLLKGKSVETTNTKAIGCTIKWAS